MAIQRIPSGIPGLDDLLFGGFLDGDAVLVAGSPGTGKSTLGMQYLYEGITRYDEPGFFITFEEFPQQIYRDAMNFGWDFRRLEEEDKLKVLFTSPELMHRDIQLHEGLFAEMMREIGAKRVVVDSITHFARLANDTGELRELIYTLINALKREGLCPLLLRELVEDEVMGAVAEEYTVDTVLHLSMDRVQNQRMRFIEVLKSRGSRHIPAKSLFFIGDQGLSVVPPFQNAFYRYQDAISVGIPDIDTLMGGGIPYGAFYLFEVAPELHREILELNLIRETSRADDYLFELTTTTTWVQKLQQLALSFGMSSELQHALSLGQNPGGLHVIPLYDHETALQPAAPLSDDGTEAADDAYFADEPTTLALGLLDQAFQQTTHTNRGRLFLDFTRLATVDGDFIYTSLTPILDMIQRYQGVCVGLLTPNAIPSDMRERLLMEADGIIRLWKEGHYTFIQVNKTVNAVQTPTHCLVESNTPPYLHVMQY